MTESRLNIISVSSSKGSSSRINRQKEMQAKFERLWLKDPEQFNPLRNCFERERIERIWTLLAEVPLHHKQAVDIGCGAGILSLRLRDAEAHVTAVDIAENALKRMHGEEFRQITLKQDAMPTTSLPDQAYDIIVCTELIAELPREDYRLFFAELARLIKPDGYLICSSAIDIHSDEGVQRLLDLAHTEFDIIQSKTSYHALFIRLKHFFEAPSRFIAAWRDPQLKQKELQTRTSLQRWRFWLQTSPFFIWLWYALEPLTRPILRVFKNSRSWLLRLEKICRFVWDEKGINHYIFLAKRRPLIKVDPQDIPIEKPKRKEIWS